MYKAEFKYQPTKKLIIFDLDHTLISTNSSYVYLKTLYQRGALSISVLLRAILLKCRYYATSMTLEKLHHVVFDRMLRGFSLEALEKHIDVLVEKLLPGALYLPAYLELMDAQKRGDYIALISSSPDFLVRRFASYFGIESGPGRDRRCWCGSNWTSNFVLRRSRALRSTYHSGSNAASPL